MNTAAAVQTAARFRNVLFATDFSPAAARAVPFVKSIVKHYDADLTALNVRVPAVDIMTGPASWPRDAAAINAEEEKHRHDLLDTFAGLRTTVLIEEGTVQSKLPATIEKNNIDLTVIGTRGRTGLGKILLGSVAEEIFRTVTCPVLTVGPHSAESKQGASGEFREILYATDLSSEFPAAAAHAVSLAEEFQARLVLLHVISEQEVGDLVSAADVTRSARELLQKMVPLEAQAWCKPEFFVEVGNPAETILAFARKRKSDLIVLGIKKETGVPGAATHLPIATAHKVVSHATCPVLTVRG